MERRVSRRFCNVAPAAPSSTGGYEMRSAAIAWSAVSLKWCLGTWLVLVAVNLPFRYVEFADEFLGESIASFPPDSHRTNAIYGGWPWQYVSLTSPPAVGQPVHWAAATWSLTALLSNFLVAAVAVATVTLLVSWSQRFATVLVWAAAFAAIGWGVYHSQQDRAVAQKLARHGMVYRSAIVPVWVTRFIPSIGLRPLVRIRGVMLFQYDQSAVNTITQLPGLHTLGFWGQLPSATQLRPLSLRPQLCKLIIADAQLEPWVPEFIASQPSLRHLELLGCSGLESGLPELNRLSELKIFDATGSDLPLSSLTHARWVQQLRLLQLSHPDSGEQTLELTGCPELELLQIRTRNDIPNPDLLTIRIDGMPQLRLFTLSSTQKASLSIANVPRLQELRVAMRDEYRTFLATNNAPLGLWLETLSVINAPSLKKLHCYGLDMKDILIQQSPNLIKLTIDRYRDGERLYADSTVDYTDHMAGLIKGLSACSGPLVIDLSTLPLQGIDLSPLAQNPRIRELQLAQTGINAEQLRAALTLPRLKKIDVRNCPISNAEAAELLVSCPQLTQFLVDASAFEQIEIVDRNQLVDFTMGPSPRAEVVRIVGSPLLRSELLLGANLKALCIEDGYSLQGLSINGPLPREAKLQGLRDLRFLAIGGSNVNDRLCEPLWQCHQLNDLTLAYTSLSRESWQRIGQFKHLKTLIIPGSDIDDSITEQWRELEHLRVVDLSHTRISRRTLSQLLVRPNLQRLALNYVALDKSDLRGLENVLQLIELEVAGIGLEEEVLRALLNRGLLDRLDLSDSVLTPQCLQLLASEAASKLIFLGLRNCGLSDAELRLIVDAQPNLLLDVENNPLSEELRQQLRASDRLLSRCDRTGFLRRITHRIPPINAAPYAVDNSSTTLLGETCDKIDIYQFATPQMVTAAR